MHNSDGSKCSQTNSCVDMVYNNQFTRKIWVKTKKKNAPKKPHLFQFRSPTEIFFTATFLALKNAAQKNALSVLSTLQFVQPFKFIDV